MNLQKKKKNFVIIYNKSKYKKIFKSKIIMTLSKSQEDFERLILANKNFSSYLCIFDG